MADETPAGLLEMRAMFDAAANKPRKIKHVDVPGMGRVWVKGLTAAEYDQFEAGCVAVDGDTVSRKANRPLLLRLCIVTEAGVKVFKDEHVEMLAGLDSSLTNPIAAEAMALCGLGAKENEDIAKN